MIRRSSTPRWHEVTAVFGGRFDPPHLGHRQAVKGLFRDPGVRRVLVLPSATPPHKPAQARFEDRAEMAKINFQATPNESYPSEVSLDFREMERARKHPTLPTYSFDTLQELRQIYSELAFVIGTDQLAQLHTWNRFPEILKLCHWIVLERKPVAAGLAQKIFQEWKSSGLVDSAHGSTWRVQGQSCFIVVVETDAPAVSSTEIRESVARTGAPPENALLPEVSAYLKEKRLYGM